MPAQELTLGITLAVLGAGLLVAIIYLIGRDWEQRPAVRSDEDQA